MTTSLFDSFGRGISYLRVSVTDVCNLRCVYCMPESQTRFTPSEDLLTAGQIVRIARIFVAEGVRKIRLTGGEPLAVRFIEYMPYGDNPWSPADHVPIAEIRGAIEREHELVPLPRTAESGPAEEFSVVGFEGTVGFISPISDRFCAGCNRIRLTSDGVLRACLFGQGCDLRPALTDGSPDAAILALIRGAVRRKEERHPLFSGMLRSGVALPSRNMNTIGG